MGRYYTGDIEGKFMFGVQSSDDANFFGVEGESRSLDYYYSEEDLPKVEEGVKECEGVLGENLKHIEQFFKENDSFSDERLAKYLSNVLDKNVTEENTRFNLEWYARLELGREIRDCIKEHGQCNFEAEL
jgi:hypothetical protein